VEEIRLTEPDGTETRISRCTDQQVLPVDVCRWIDYLSLC